ncbi:MAG: universal stress protein [Candidatus Cyclobacteriaceae bacterium M3_2C_046]
MKQLKKILIPVDFTERSVNALKHAIELSHQLPSELYLLHVYHRKIIRLPRKMEGSKLNLRNLQAYSLKKAGHQIDQKFSELINGVPELNKKSFQIRKVLGNTENEILTFAENNKIDLIIMGTKSIYGLEEVWGKVTAQIVDKASCPVLVIPENSTKLELNKIALACDYKKMDLNSLHFLKELAQACEAELEVINISPGGKKTEKEIKNALYLNDYVKPVNRRFKHAEGENVEEELVNYVGSNNIGLLALVRKQRSLIGKFFHQSLTKKMVKHASMPLLTFRTG